MPNKMKRYFYILLLMLSFCLAGQKSYAQIDPVLTGMIIRFTNTSTKQYSKQMAAMSHKPRDMYGYKAKLNP